MDETPSPAPLTDKALARLRALAKGNRLDPAKIILTAGEEKTYTLEGTTVLAPLFETRAERYSGAPRGKIDQTLANVATLQVEVKKREAEFRSRPDWVAAVSTELRKQPGEGWGLSGARVELPDHSVTLAASEACATCRGQKTLPCPQCQGHGYETCVQCRGMRQEFCYNCNYNNSGIGSGSNQIGPGQVCHICNGRRFISCRPCRGTGQIGCPQCQARGQIPCSACKGAGQTTEVIHITCGATTSFGFKGEELPSSLRRGLDRLGAANLAKGHAEIAFVENKKIEEPEEPEEIIPGGLYGIAPSSVPRAATPEENLDPGFGTPADRSKPQQPMLHYSARLPFADMRVDFGGRKAAIGVFGLRHLFVDVPPFLDDVLNPALQKLAAAVKGRGTVNAALETRALHEALELHLQAKGNIKEFRRLYPVGISGGVMENILRGTHSSIKRLTLLTRIIAAAASSVLAAGLFAACYFSSLPIRAAYGPRWSLPALDFLPPVAAGILGMAALTFAAYFDLHRHFPAAKIGLRQPAGKTGYALLAVIVIIWLAVLAFSPARPPWLPLPIH